MLIDTLLTTIITADTITAIVFIVFAIAILFQKKDEIAKWQEKISRK